LGTLFGEIWIKGAGYYKNKNLEPNYSSLRLSFFAK
jgi:hypothetical protein